ncbi:fatty acyl-CoA reductase wat-like [Adelges cooleyi]|uniref:fatty acyl-CoA reductase wat-like n=1 Tax=Adelges cooleyi TaxID=133065 RepID=UPI00217FD0A4|nr:fatty acyl-CoA reductase wat-like [Adelges cooleyi]
MASANKIMENCNSCQNNTSPSLSEVQSFYNGTTVFLTGATGFVGILILEKLIRTCSGIKRIYILIREKKGKTTEERFKDLFDNPVFEVMKKETPDYLEKVTAVIGDCVQPNLGLSEQDRVMLQNEVNIVIHSAATVRFDEHMKRAVKINIVALQDLLKISHEIKCLKAFVHISTAYCNCAGRTAVDEIFYDLPISGDDLMKVMDSLSDDYIDKVTPKILDKWPNTYAFTKAIGEGEILKYGKGLPLGVVRPSMIIATANEPVRGWINNVYGPTGVVAAVGVGLLRTMCADPNTYADCVPGDFVSNAVIVSAWDINNKWKSHKNTNSWEVESAGDKTFSTPIYNCVSTTTNPFTWGEFATFNQRHGLEVPSTQIIWPYMLKLTGSKTEYAVLSFLGHTVPAHVVDSLAKLMGKPPRLVDAYKKIHKFVDVISFFSLKSWTFYDTNTRNLISAMSDQDKTLFDFDVAKIDWDDYFKYHIRGIRCFIFKDPLDTVPEGTVHYRKMLTIYYTLFAFLWAILLLIIYGVFLLFQ